MSKRKLTYHKILDYLKNKISNKEKHLLEKEAMKDPFEEDALEGLSSLSAMEFEQDIKLLQEKINSKSKKKTRNVVYLRYKIAASILIIVGLGTLVYLINPEKEQRIIIDDSENVVTSPIQEETDETTVFEKLETKKPIINNNTQVEESIVLDTESELEEIEIDKVEKEVVEKVEKKNSDAIVAKTHAIEIELTTVKDQDPSSENAIQPIQGIVTDTNGEPLPGVSVSIDGSNKGVVTGFDGAFQINTKQNSDLIFNYIGFEKAIKPANDSMLVALQENKAALDEIVVIGYGTQKKKEITGAVNSIKAEELERTTNSDLKSALEGRLAGVSLHKSKKSIKIRGTSSIDSLTQSPLYIIDGSIKTTNFIKFDPDEIASIDIIKEASKLSIYGTSGANGVVLITTKRGLLHRAIFNDRNATRKNTLSFHKEIQKFKTWIISKLDKSLFEKNRSYSIKTRFEINKKGQIKNIKISNYSKKKIKRNFKSVLNESPKWIPSTKIDNSLTKDNIELTFDIKFE